MDKLNLIAMEENAGEAEAMLSLMANRHRLLVMCSLIDGEKTVTQLLDKSTLSQSALSQHLGKLREADLVTTRRSGQKIYYTLASEAAQRLIETLCGIYSKGPKP